MWIKKLKLINIDILYSSSLNCLYKKATKWPNVQNNRTINWTNVQNNHNFSHILMILLQKFLFNIKLLGDNSRTRDTNHQNVMTMQQSNVREYLQNIL